MRGSDRLAAERNTRSAARNAGRRTRRRSTATWWRRTTSSRSFDACDRNRRKSSCRTRWTATYRTDRTTAPPTTRRQARYFMQDRINALHTLRRSNRRIPRRPCRLWRPTPTRRRRTENNELCHSPRDSCRIEADACSVSRGKVARHLGRFSQLSHHCGVWTKPLARRTLRVRRARSAG
jgi:hypothetical protein